MTGALAPTASTVFDGKPLPTRAETIAIINRLVNAGIVTDRRNIPLAQEVWSIAPLIGQCHDYVVTKQWLLRAYGIKSFRAECVVPDNEHHLVLLVDDVVLDSLRSNLLPIDKTGYSWKRRQSADNPQLWETM